jgi:endoglucanase
MRNLIGLVLIVYCIAGHGQTAPLSQVSVKGNKFVTADGKPIVFHGLNASDPDKLDREGHWDKTYFAEMKKWGANLVRLPVHPTAWQKRGAEDYLKLLDKGVALASEQGLYVVIDWHSIGNLKTEMYMLPMYETTLKETREFWRTIAKRYKGNTTVAFFELYNEPTIMRGELGNCSWKEWKAINEEIITIVRACGSTAVPLVAGFNWAYDLKDVVKDPINAEGIGYVSHPYPQKREKPWEKKWTDDWGHVAEKYPLMLTEIGFCHAGERGAHNPVVSDESYGDAITKYTAERGISWVVWVFDPNWAPMMFTDWYFTPTSQGKYFKDAMQKAAKVQ